MTWQAGDSEFRWLWLVFVLIGVLVLLMVLWRWVWWRPKPTNPAYVAHAARLRSLPRYAALVRRRVVFGTCLSLAALITCAGGIVLAGRVQERQTMEQNDRTRDIILCLDASGSMAEVDAEVLREFQKIVDGLQGERIGLTIWSGAAITVFPLTDDYDFASEQLKEAEAAFNGDVYSDEYAIFTAGTVIDWSTQSQIGDGLASCVQRFDRREEDRSRAIVLASDNEPLGSGIFTISDAADYAAEESVIVHGIAAPMTAERPSALRQFDSSVTGTGGTFALLGADGSAEAVIESIGKLEAKKIDRPPLVQILDRPDLGTLIAGIGVGGLLLIWVAEAVLAIRNRRPGSDDPTTGAPR